MNARPDRGLAAVQSEWQDDTDRLAPCGQDPADDRLEQQAADHAAVDRAHDHAPVYQPPAGVQAEQPTQRERAAHRRRRRAPWTVCECGAWEKGYRHPGHRYRCPRYAVVELREDAA